MRTTYEQDQQFISELLKDKRQETIEECVAAAAEWFMVQDGYDGSSCLDAIRALKNKP